MSELLFIAITIFAAYVIFSVVKTPGGDSGLSELKTENPPTTHNEPAPTPSEAAPAAAPAKSATAVAAVKTDTTPAPVAKPAKVAAEKPAKAAKPAKSSSRKAKPATETPVAPAVSEAAAASDSDSIKNPKTGEVAKVPGNYAFAKRWIKDALVAEGLLDKVYKNTELDNATQAKIQAAIQQLKAMPKYQA